MRRWLKITIGLVVFVAVGAGVGWWWFSTRDLREPSFVAWNSHCAGCHGKTLVGTAAGPALVDVNLRDGDEVEQMAAVIAKGIPGTAMAGWDDRLSPQLVRGLAIFISERRQKFPTIAESYAHEPQGVRHIKSMHHDFRVERVATLRSRPYSLAYMPDGRILIVEKTRGLSFVDRHGRQGPLIEGTPPVWGKIISLEGAWINLGSLLDVELHPDFAKNGWIYLSYTDRCQLSCGTLLPSTMVRVVRGRIKNGKWIDQQVIWSVHKDHYTPLPDALAAGRLAFDKRGFLYISVGGKNTYDKLHQLDTPYGKIHRVRDDGAVPNDNPFWAPPGKRPESSTIQTVWSYGHRTPEGLDVDPVTGEVWSTEMGPRGGDEVNKILRGRNYGWPLYTNGLDYDGEEVAIGKKLGLKFAIADTVLPVVDFTPAPALSSFTFNHGSRFPGWKNDILLGSLKAETFYRLRLEGDKLVEQEKLITGFGRIRDVKMGGDGLVYMVLEHNDSGSLWRLVPE